MVIVLEPAAVVDDILALVVAMSFSPSLMPLLLQYFL